MARICDICSRGSRMSISRSHSNIATKHRQFLNLQNKKVEGVRMRICTHCIKCQVKAAAKA